MSRYFRWACAHTLCVLFALPAAVGASTVSYDLSFETSGQSIWDTGTSFTLDETAFLGVAWQDKTVSLDAMVGEEDASLLNPLRTGYDVAFAACRLGFSSSACINGQKGRLYVPKLGSRPSVRSCGRYAVACKAKRLVDLGKRATYDGALKLCRKAFSSSVCRNGQSARLPVIALGTAPPKYLTVDTRTGGAIEGSSDGRVGLELGIEIDSGSVDATVSYAAMLDIPDTTGLASGAVISFNPDSELAGVNTLDTTFADLELSLNAIMELSGGVSAEVCAIGACAADGTTFDIAAVAPILSFNADGEGGILLLGESPSEFGYPAEADGLPVSFDVAGLAEITLHLPQPAATGGLDTTTDTLKATGQDDLLDLLLDVDNIVATAAGVPGLFGQEQSFGRFTAGYDIINVEMGPTIDLKQDFELDPTLWVELVFDEAVQIGGELVTVWTSAWDLLPDITFLADSTMVTPTFFLEASLDNSTLLDFDLAFIIDLLQITYGFDLPPGFDDLTGSIGIGNVLDGAVDLFESPDLYSKLFDLHGFNLQIGESFVINLGGTSTAPSALTATSAVNTIVLLADPVPEPATVLLVLGALLGLHALRRRDRRAGTLLALAGGGTAALVA